ncbi:putative disease resistance protein At3g14460 [Ziziphus jujuba]|uniref:Disease resistance protein At3g14460 n=1 Tax=Ziziphus jujuba TaxID=326968 RepID=A0ABM3I1F7_ZIZJJ|nr:putative disease resistance protein At3g14460 [Ziziphus jujuba]
MLEPRVSSHLQIVNCPNFIYFSERGFHAPSLAGFAVGAYKKLEVLPEEMSNLFPSLKTLYISFCQELESFPEGGLPSNLIKLEVLNCCKLIANRKKWNLQKLHALKQLIIRDEFGGAGVESFPEDGLLPSTLTVLNISGIASLERVKIKGLQQISSLQCLGIKSCPQLRNLPEERFFKYL